MSTCYEFRDQKENQFEAFTDRHEKLAHKANASFSRQRNRWKPNC